MTRITDTLHEDLCTLMIISRPVLLRMRYVSGENRTENQNTHFMFNNFFFENLSFHELMRRNIVQPGSTQMTILRTRNACRIHKATNTHLEYAILIAFPLQQ